MSKLHLAVVCLSVTVVLCPANCLAIAWDIDIKNNTDPEQLDNWSEYCFVNDSVVRRKLNGAQFNIIDSTGDDWLVANNGTDLFTIPSNLSDCDSSYQPDIDVYYLKTTINCLIIALATCIIALHWYIKELRTEPGILIIMLCSTLFIGYVVILFYNRYQYTHKVNDSSAVCAVLVYIRGTLVFFYHSIVVTIFFHFANLMYKAYKVRSVSSTFDRKLMLKYVMFIISLTTACVLIVIPHDVAVTRNAFDTTGGYCKIEFEDRATKSFYIYIAALSLAIVTQMIIFCLGMIFYFLSSQNFKSINIRVCLALISTSGLNTFLYLISYSLSGTTYIPEVLSSIATVVEQLVLLVIFSTSVKVKSAITSTTSQHTQQGLV